MKKLKQFSIEDFDEHTCMYNSYLVITGKREYTDILEEEEGAGFIFNPTKPYYPMPDDAYDILIDYFKEIEKYEICDELKRSKELALLMEII